MSDKENLTEGTLFPAHINIETNMPSLPHHLTVLHIRNSKTERRQMEKIMKEYNFEEHELHLFFWYMGYRLALDNFLNRSMSDPPAEPAVRAFIARHLGIH